MTQQIFALHYLFTIKSDKVIAHCLDLDLVVTANDETTAEQRLNALVRAEFSLAFGTTPPARLIAAPPHYWAQLKRAKPLPTATLKIDSPPMVFAVEQAVAAEMPVLRSEVEFSSAA